MPIKEKTSLSAEEAHILSLVESGVQVPEHLIDKAHYYLGMDCGLIDVGGRYSLTQKGRALLLATHDLVAQAEADAAARYSLTKKGRDFLSSQQPVASACEADLPPDEQGQEKKTSAETVEEAFARGRAEGTRNESRKREWVKAEYEKLVRELADAKAKLFAVKAAKEDVWFWDPSGGNNEGSLTCPIVMRPETLQEIRDSERALGRAECDRPHGVPGDEPWIAVSTALPTVEQAVYAKTFDHAVYVKIYTGDKWWRRNVVAWKRFK